MKVIELELSPSLYRRAEALAAAQSCSVPALLTALIEQGVEAAAPADELTGSFADAPDLIDEVVEEAFTDRERRWAAARD